MLRTILAVLVVYVLICGLLGDYRPTGSYTETDIVVETSEQLTNISGESDYGMLADEGDAVVILSPTTGDY